MNILQVVEPGRDGVFRHVEDLIHFLTRPGHTVSLAYSDRRACDQLPKLVEWVRAHGGAVLNLSVGNAPEPGDLGALVALGRFIRERKFQVIHAHSSKAGGLSRLLAPLCRKPEFFYTPHAYFAMDGRRGPKPAIYNAIERALAPAATTVNVSEDEAKFARDQLGVRSTGQLVIPNPVDTERYQPCSPEQKAAVRASLGIPAGATVVGAIGRLSFQKNPQMLYTAFATAARRRPNLFLFHLGDGDLEHEVDAIVAKNQLAESVLQKPYLQDTRLFYQAVDMLVMTSRFEGMSYAVLEALSSDLPLVLTDVPGNRDFFRIGLSHVEKCPSENGEACAAGIEKMCERLSRAEPINHRQLAIERFGMEACFTRLLHRYEGKA